MVKNPGSFKTIVFFRKSFQRFMEFAQKAVYHVRESTPQASIMEEHSSSPTMRLTTSTITQGAKCHTEITFFSLRLSWVCFILALAWLPLFQAHEWLSNVDLFIPSHLHLTQKLPPNPLLPTLAGFSLILQILCASVLHWPRGHGIPQLDCQFSQVGPWLLAFPGIREGKCWSLGCSELQEHLG